MIRRSRDPLRRAAFCLVAFFVTAGANGAASAAPPPDPAASATSPSTPPPPSASAPAPSSPAPVTGADVPAKKPDDAPSADTALVPLPKKRHLPDYGGRGSAPSTAGDVALWVPRIALSPLYFVSEYMLRRPLGALITVAERGNVPQVLYDFFTFGPDHSAGFAPIAFIDFGSQTSVGVYAFWDNAFVKGHDLSAHFSFWGGDWLAGVFTDRIRFAKGRAVTFNFTANRRPDHLYFGNGPRTLESDRSRYKEDFIDANAAMSVPFYRSSKVESWVGVRSARFASSTFGGDPSFEEQATKGTFPVPAGYDNGYTAAYSRVRAALDTRRPRPAPASGVRVEVEGEAGSDIQHSPGPSWLRYGATVGGFVDLGNTHRVVSLSVGTKFAAPLEHQTIPFTELVTLGGYDTMRGFWPGRLYDRSGAVATVRYRWPIWVWIDGVMEAATGNVFGDHLEEFKPGLLRLSGALGFESVGSPDSSIEFLIGFGTETFDQGTKVDSFRLVFGTNRGF